MDPALEKESEEGKCRKSWHGTNQTAWFVAIDIKKDVKILAFTGSHEFYM